MKFRWTIEDCRTYSDLRIVAGLINERLSDLNPYSPFAKRLKAMRDKITNKEPLTSEDTPEGDVTPA